MRQRVSKVVPRPSSSWPYRTFLPFVFGLRLPSLSYSSGYFHCSPRSSIHFSSRRVTNCGTWPVMTIVSSPPVFDFAFGWIEPSLAVKLIEPGLLAETCITSDLSGKLAKDSRVYVTPSCVYDIGRAHV